MIEWLKNIPIEPAQFVYGALALCGGIARYLNGLGSGSTFSPGLLLASAFVSGFSGYMFALLGVAMSLPENIVFIMAGTGGFFGDQTMKYIMEYLQQSQVK